MSPELRTTLDAVALELARLRKALENAAHAMREASLAMTCDPSNTAARRILRDGARAAREAAGTESARGER